MIQNVLRGIGGVGAYGVISICLFFGVFVGVLLWTASLRKPYLSEMSELPLEKDAAGEPEFETSANPGNSHERV